MESQHSFEIETADGLFPRPFKPATAISPIIRSNNPADDFVLAINGTLPKPERMEVFKN